MTTRLLLVADNRSLGLGLAGQDFDVIDVQPEDLAESTAPDGSTDLVVVGVEHPHDALAAVAMCQQRQDGIPTLLVRGDDPHWAAVESSMSGRVGVLCLPVTRVSLLAAIRRLVTADGQAPTGAPPAPEESSAGRQSARRLVAARSTDALRERLAQRSQQDAANAGRTSAVTDVADHSDPGPHEHAISEPDPVGQPYAQWDQLRPRSPDNAGVGALIQALLDRITELVDVRDAADGLAGEVANLAHAPHAAVLLPDGETFHVCGSAGLRPLELRYVVEADSWLVETVVEGRRGVIIEDSDIARQRLGGAPLAHHRHLMAAPITTTRGLVVLARDDDAFDEVELAAVAGAAEDAGAVLAEALQVRSLARALTDFRDAPE